MGRARRPSHSILPRSRAEQSLRASLDPARTYLQGGGYDSRQCRADTQLAMIGVSMRVTPIALGTCQEQIGPVITSRLKYTFWCEMFDGLCVASSGDLTFAVTAFLTLHCPQCVYNIRLTISIAVCRCAAQCCRTWRSFDSNHSRSLLGAFAVIDLTRFISSLLASSSAMRSMGDFPARNAFFNEFLTS